MRYKVEITVELKNCSDDDEPADEFDEDEMIRFMLEGEDEFNLHDFSEEEDHYQRKVYDLCSSCHKAYLKDPLFRNVRHRFGFREN